MLYTKEIIKNKWGEYCDTDKLVDDMIALLTEYGHRNSEHGVCTIIDRYFTNKEPLVKLLAKHDKYVGNMRITLKVPFARDCVASTIQGFVDNFRANQEVKDCILSYTDEDGKVMTDYFKTGVRHMNIKNMKKAKNILHDEKVKQFMLFNGALRKSAEKEAQFQDWMYYMSNQFVSNLSEDVENYGISLKKGMKTSRAFNRICTTYGVDKYQSYNKEFAKYADMVSSNERILNVIISVNPLDYLTMSFGKSWASCHTIDKNNARGMPNSYSGAYCNGTLSYMLDESSIITYVVEDMGDELHKIGKLYRNMFHVNMETCKFIQGRIYPQGNDGSTDLYAKFRKIMQDEFVKLFGLSNNMWKVKRVEGSLDSNSYGLHYQDYNSYDDCRVFYPSEKGNIGVVEIGSNAPCAYCGDECDSYDRLSHYSCEI